MLSFLARTQIQASIEKVFAFHERPDAFELLAPPGAGIEILRREGGLQVGAETLIRLPLIPWAGRWKIEWLARHTVYLPPHLFVDEQIRGPFAYWRHEHRFEARGDATLLEDRIHFCLKGGPILDFFGGPIAKIQLRRMFQFRHMMTKKYCE